MKFTHFLLIVLILSCSVCFAEQWQNPANRYLNSHLAYKDKQCPIKEDNIKHFVYFAKDRKSIKNHKMLVHQRFAGAQIMYSWKQLEPEKDKYDFSLIESDLSYLKTHGKTLFVQLQDASFSTKYNPIPDYLMQASGFSGAVVHTENNMPVGWVAKRWDPKVQNRFRLLIKALGKHFDGKIEGINLQETAISIDESNDQAFTEYKYLEGLKQNMKSLKAAFNESTTMIYANFLPGEWLPWEDKGYLKSIYQYGEQIGVGLGAPDLMYKRKAQLNHALAQMHENEFSVPIGIAIQDGNYLGKTGADTDYKEPQNKTTRYESIVPSLHAFAEDFLDVDYMFWVNQEPYMVNDVLPCFQ